MALNVWLESSGYSFGTFEERLQISLQLPVSPVPMPGITYSVISGALPPGLRIENNYIIGTPGEVARDTTYSFCVRAHLNNEILQSLSLLPVH